MTNMVHVARGSDVSLTMVAGKVWVGELVEMPYEPIRRGALAVGTALIGETWIDPAV